MELTVDNLDTLRDVHDLLDGVNTLLLGLAEYDGVDRDVRSALNIIVAELDTGKEKLMEVLNSEDKQEMP